MHRKSNWMLSGLVLLALLLAGCVPHPATVSEGGTPMALKSACLQATQKAVDLEIQRYQAWLQNSKDPAKVQTYKQRLVALQAEREKYGKMGPADYTLPESITIEGWFDHPCQTGSIINFAKLTRSGPFYHVIGIVGGDYSTFKPDVHYQMTLSLVYPRTYPFPSEYVCITAFQQK